MTPLTPLPSRAQLAPRAPLEPLRRLDRLLGAPVPVRILALLRMAAGPVLLLHLEPLLRDAADGRAWSDVANEAYLSWYPELTRGAWFAAVWLAGAAAVCMTVGLLARVAVTYAFVFVAWNTFLSKTHFHNNRAYLMVLLGAMALAPCGRELSVDAVLVRWWRRRAGRPRPPTAAWMPGWPLWLARFEASVVYSASAFSKLIDPDWRGGLVTWDRVVRVEERLRTRTPLPDWFVDLITTRSFHTGFAKVVIATELCIGLGLWSRRVRPVSVWLAIWFHLVVELVADVQVFSWLGLAALALWTAPTRRDRTLRTPHARLARVVRRLDWLARYRVEVRPGPTELVEADGRVRSGAGAVLTTLARTPLGYLPLAPILALSAVVARRRVAA